MILSPIARYGFSRPVIDSAKFHDVGKVGISDVILKKTFPRFTDEERNKMTELLNSGFTDSFRYLYPEKENIYSWWSYMFHAREKNAGWRIDYFIVSKSIEEKIKESSIYAEVMGSDHCPVGIEIDI